MSNVTPEAMTSSKPYLLRATYEWLVDNGSRVFIVVDMSYPGIKVPSQMSRDGGKTAILNISPSATPDLLMRNELISFGCTSAGRHYSIELPIGAVMAIYGPDSPAKGQGMTFPPENLKGESIPVAEEVTIKADEPKEEDGKKRPPFLTIVK